MAYPTTITDSCFRDSCIFTGKAPVWPVFTLLPRSSDWEPMLFILYLPGPDPQNDNIGMYTEKSKEPYTYPRFTRLLTLKAVFSFDSAKLPVIYGVPCILLFNISLNRNAQLPGFFTLILHLWGHYRKLCTVCLANSFTLNLHCMLWGQQKGYMGV